MQTVLEGELLVVSVSDDGRVARITRTSRPSKDGTFGEIERLEQEIARLPAERMAAIVDVRQAPGRNDDAFEKTILPRFRAITGRFARIAFLVSTRVGMLQVQRLEKSLGMNGRVFVDEQEAVRFVSG